MINKICSGFGLLDFPRQQVWKHLVVHKNRQKK